MLVLLLHIVLVTDHEARLSGYCNYITATVYCLEDYVHLGLREEEKLKKLQTWNQPRKRNVEPT